MPIEDPSSKPPDPASRPRPAARDLPGWLFAVLIVICLMGGAGFVWWFFHDASPVRVDIVLQDEDGGPDLQPDDLPPAIPWVELPPPTRMTVNWQQTPLRDVLDDLSKRIDFPILLINAPASFGRTPVTFSAQDMSFWEVVDALCQQVGLRPVHDLYNRPALRLERIRRGGGSARPTIFAGPVMIIADSVWVAGHADPADNSVKRSLLLSLHVAGEPTGSLVGILPRPEITHAENQHGTSLLTDQSGPAVMVNVRHSPVAPASVDLAYDPQSTRLKTIQGTFTIIACDRIRPIDLDIPGAAGPTSQAIDGLRVDFEALRPIKNDGFQAIITVRGAGLNDPRIEYRFSHSIKHEPVRLLDAEGRAYLESVSRGYGRADEDHYQIRVSFDKPPGEIGPPAKLVIMFPEGLKRIRIPFTFTDLPIP